MGTPVGGPPFQTPAVPPSPANNLLAQYLTGMTTLAAQVQQTVGNPANAAALAHLNNQATATQHAFTTAWNAMHAAPPPPPPPPPGNG
jgi:hypothetical protein